MSEVEEQKLVVVGEDDADLRGVLVETLTGAGFLVEAYASGKELLEALRARFARHDGSPYLVLTDLFLGDDNGLQVISKVRQFDRSTRVVLMTGIIREKLRLAAESLGAAFLPKPFTSAQLWKVFGEAPARWRSR